MGAYMSKPIIEKESENGGGNGVTYGGSSMQGWRVSQEDAHNCVAELDENSSFFGVYDGHGGAEVAIYLSRHFPEFVKTTEGYKNGKIDEGLKEAFLKMDEKIKQDEAMQEIKLLVKELKGENTEGESSVDYEDENVGELYVEATMPLEELVEKYTSKGGSTEESRSASSTASSSEGPCSSRKILFAAAGSSSSKETMAGGSGSSAKASGSTCSSNSNKTVAKEEVAEAPPVLSDATSTLSKDEIRIEINGSSKEVCSEKPEEDVPKSLEASIPEATKDVAKTNGSVSSNAEPKVASSIKGENDTENKQENLSNGDEKNSAQEAVDETELIKDASQPETPPPKPRKGKVHPPPVIATPTPTEEPNSKRRSPRKSGIASLAFGKDSDDSDLDSSDSDHPDPGADADSDEDSDDAGDDDGTSSDDENAEDSDEEEDDDFLSGIQEPVYDSGTTAVVALLKRQDEKVNLWVANAGDSRCVLSRSGKAIEMSHDHKPESEEETLRIINAGGKITDDGRVNGGLNLSRAIGDHSYKGNVSLPPEEQMISPLPTVQHIEIDPELDDFLVLACDGVWNSYSSQEVVDFVSSKIATAPSLSHICEELFDACLAPNTHGDGTGCDNMTAIIVQLRKEIAPRKKRTLNSEDSDDEEKCVQARKKCKE